MHRFRFFVYSLFVGLVSFFILIPVAFALQEGEEKLDIRLKRNFGSSLGGNIQGTFSIRASGPDDFSRIEFYIDDQLIGEDTDSPFQYRFQTGDYELGIHRIRAIGYTTEGQKIQSNVLTRQFDSGSSVWWIIIAIVVLVVGFRAVSYFLTRQSTRGEPGRQSYGYLGGAICPNCGQPFAIHWWSINLGAGRLDRCSHCGKWNLVRRSSTEALMMAEEEKTKVEGQQGTDGRDEEDYQSQLNDSRYIDN